MAFSKIRFESGRPRETPAATFKRVFNSFNGHLSNVYLYKISIRRNKASIPDAEVLTKEIVGRGLADDQRTLLLFKKAVILVNTLCSQALDKPYSYELDLGKLLPAHLTSHDFQGKANEFLNANSREIALKILREIGVVKNDYESPIGDLMKHTPGMGRTDDDVTRLMINWFLAIISNALKAKVQLKFDQASITKPEDLTPQVVAHGLEENGRILSLFVKAIESSTLMAYKNAKSRYTFTLDLALLSPENLKRHKVKDEKVDYIIDGSNSREAIDLFYRICALETELPDAEKKKQPEFSFRIMPNGLFYPE